MTDFSLQDANFVVTGGILTTSSGATSQNKLLVFSSHMEIFLSLSNL